MRTLMPNSMWLSSRRGPSIFDDFDDLMSGFKWPCDIHETSHHYLVSFDMPGVDRKSIHVKIQDHQLIVSAEKTSSIPHKKMDSVVYKGRSYGKFQRTIELPPDTVRMDGIEAHYEDGVLEVALPKQEASLPEAKQIEVQSGKGGFFSRLLGEKKSQEPESEKS